MIDNPVLPEGWLSLTEDKEILIIERPGVGGVTIHWDLRSALPGYQRSHVGKPIAGGPYIGRGWRERLLADAIAWLEALSPITKAGV